MSNSEDFRELFGETNKINEGLEKEDLVNEFEVDPKDFEDEDADDVEDFSPAAELGRDVEAEEDRIEKIHVGLEQAKAEYEKDPDSTIWPTIIHGLEAALGAYEKNEGKVEEGQPDAKSPGKSPAKSPKKDPDHKDENE